MEAVTRTQASSVAQYINRCRKDKSLPAILDYDNPKVLWEAPRKDDHGVIIRVALGATAQESRKIIRAMLKVLAEGGFVCKAGKRAVHITGRIGAYTRPPEALRSVWATDMADRALRERFPTEWREEYDKALKIAEDS